MKTYTEYLFFNTKKSKEIINITSQVEEAVKRNLNRFPDDFCFVLTREEILRMSQIVTSSGTLKFSKNVTAFTENGVAMLSSVLRSERAVQVNIQIMRIFAKLRQILASHKDLITKLNDLEQKTGKNSADIKLVFNAIRKLLAPPKKPKRRIGFLV